MTIGNQSSPNLFPELADARFCVADVETTGLDAATDRVVEFALVRFECGRPKDRFSALVDPFRPIPATASAVHLLTDRHVAGRPSLNDFAADILTFVNGAPVVSHNAAFDRPFLPMLDEGLWICSYRLARRIWPDAPRHTNSVLRFWLDLDDGGDLAAIVPHRAEGDALVTGSLFLRELAELARTDAAATLDDVGEICWAPIPVRRFNFGRKYRGELIADIPTDYLIWTCNEATKPPGQRMMTLDADTLASVAAEIQSRSEEPPF